MSDSDVEIKELIISLKSRVELRKYGMIAIDRRAEGCRPFLKPETLKVLSQAHIIELEYLIKKLEQLVS